MDAAISFSILEIEKTKDRAAIQDAYRRLLVKTNPEDDPEGFKRLREAYEAANAYADAPEEEERKPETPVEIWISRAADLYGTFSRRIDPECWRELLADEICLGLDTAVEARDSLLQYLMDHYRLKTGVWKLIDRTFQLQEEREALLEKFPANYINFVLHECKSDEDFPFELFEGDDYADYDTFLYHYYELCRQNDSGDVQGAQKSIETLEQLLVYHPQLELERARCLGNQERYEEAARLVRPLLEKHGDQIRILSYAGELLWNNGERDCAADCFETIIKELPTHYTANKYLARYYQEEKHDSEKAKEYCVEALRISAQEEALLDSMRQINADLMALYEKRLLEGTASEEDLLELGWCYLQNDLGEKGVALLKDREITGKRRAESFNLLSKCYFTQQQYREAVETGEQAIACNKAWEPEDEEEAAKLPGRLAGSYEVISKAWQMLAKASGTPEESKACISKAIAAMDLALEQEPENRNYRIEKAQLYLEQHENEKAIDVCDALLEADEQDFYACVLRQKACFELHNGQGVVDDFYRAKEIFSGYPPIYELACEVFLKYNQPEDARGILRQAQEAEVSSPKLKLLHLTISRETAETEEELQAAYNEAMALYEEFRKHQEEALPEQWAELAYHTARCCRGLDRHQEALKYIEEALSLKEGEPLYLWIRANTLSDLNKPEKAMEDYLLCEQFYGDSELVYENMARCYRKLQKWEKAVEYYQKVLRVNEENQRANSYIVDICTDRLKATGDLKYYEEALPHATRQIELTPTAYYYIERGLLYLEAGVWDEAIEDFKKAAELEPENTYAYNNWGCVYRYREEYDKAIELLTKSIEVMKDNETLTPYYNMGSCYERMADFAKAAAWYKRGSELFPKNRGIREDLLRICKKMHLTDKALALAEELYASGTVKRYIEFGYIYKQCGQYDKAMRCFKEAKKVSGVDGDPYNQMGYLYLYHKKKPKQALAMFEKALELQKETDGGYDKTCRNIMECYYELGTPEKGRPYQERALKALEAQYGSIEHYLSNYYYKKARLYAVGAIYYYAGDLEKAREYFNQIEAEPKCRHCNYKECEDYWEAMGFLFEEEGNIPEAVKCYQKACRESVNNDLSICKVEKLTKKLSKRR